MGKILANSEEAREKGIPFRIVTRHLGSSVETHTWVHSCEEIRERKGFKQLTEGDIVYVRFHGKNCIEPMRFEGMTPWPGSTGEGKPTPLLQQIPPEEVEEERIIGTLSIVFPH